MLKWLFAEKHQMQSRSVCQLIITETEVVLSSLKTFVREVLD